MTFMGRILLLPDDKTQKLVQNPSNSDYFEFFEIFFAFHCNETTTDCIFAIGLGFSTHLGDGLEVIFGSPSFFCAHTGTRVATMAPNGAADLLLRQKMPNYAATIVLYLP